MSSRAPAGLPHTPRDRAERVVFAALPDLPAPARRTLALVELAGANRSEAGRELALGEADIAHLLTVARKALRQRSGAPLPAGGRCERTEALVSDRIDGVLDDDARARLDAHLARCPRCRDHVALLDDGRAALREAFAAGEQRAREPAPAPEPAEPAPSARLRVVPPPVTEVIVAKEPPPAAVQAPPPAAVQAPPPAAVKPPPPPPPLPARRPAAAIAAHRGRGRGPAAARALATVLLVLGLIAGAIAVLNAIDGDQRPDRAPWSAPSAPDVRPAPLSGQ